MRSEILGSALIAFAEKYPWSKDRYAPQREAAAERADALLEALGLAPLAEANPYSLYAIRRPKAALKPR